MASTDREIPIACNLEAIDPEARQLHRALGGRVIRARRAVHELDDGWSLALTFDMDSARDTFHFFLLERLCCPFLSISLDLDPGSSVLLVHLTGGEGVKEFLADTPLVETPLSPSA